MIRIFFLSQSSPILELFPFDKITLKSYICTVVTVMAKQCWSQTVLESGSWGHSVLQTPALVINPCCRCITSPYRKRTHTLDILCLSRGSIIAIIVPPVGCPRNSLHVSVCREHKHGCTAVWHGSLLDRLEIWHLHTSAILLHCPPTGLSKVN